MVHTLIDQLLAAPYKPPPDLLRQIVEAGETTVEPLLVALRELDGLEQDLSFVVALLGSIQNKAAVPDLTQVAYRPDCNMYEIQNGMAFGLARMGEIDALLTIAADDAALLCAREAALTALHCVACQGDLPVGQMIAERFCQLLSQFMAQGEALSSDGEFLGECLIDFLLWQEEFFTQYDSESLLAAGISPAFLIKLWNLPDQASGLRYRWFIYWAEYPHGSSLTSQQDRYIIVWRDWITAYADSPVADSLSVLHYVTTWYKTAPNYSVENDAPIRALPQNPQFSCGIVQ